MQVPLLPYPNGLHIFVFKDDGAWPEKWFLGEGLILLRSVAKGFVVAGNVASAIT